MGQDRVMDQKHADVLGALGFIARLTGQRQIALAVTPPLGAWHDVLYLQRHATPVAVGAAPAPLLKQVLFRLVAGQRALLVSALPRYAGPAWPGCQTSPAPMRTP